MGDDKNAALRGIFWVLLASVLWSTAGVAIKWLEGLPPFGVSAGRALIACLCFLALLRGKVGLGGAGKGAILAGSSIYALVVTSFVLANSLTTAANAILLQYTAPLWIALLGWMLLGERPTRRELLALALGGTGVVLCMAESLSLFAESGSLSRSLVGDAIALFSGICFAAMTITFRKFGRAAASTGRSPSSLRMLFYGNGFAATLGVAVVLAQSGGSASISLGPAGLFVLLWLGIFQLAGGYWCYQRGLRSVPALTASLLCLIEPLLNPLWVLLLVGEVPGLGTLAGGALVLVSVLWILWGQYGGAGPSGSK